MSYLYIRQTKVTVGGRVFTDPLTIYFEIPFDDTAALNTATIQIYNLMDATIKGIRKGQSIMLEAGYKGDTGIVFDGVVSTVTSKWEGLDKITTITCSDDAGNKWTTAKIKKTFAGPIAASAILKALIPLTGLAIGELSLPKDFVYKKGKSFNSKVSAAILSVGKDCNAKTHVTKRKLFMRKQDKGDLFAIEVNKETGLIGTPSPLETQNDSPDGKTKTTSQGYAVTTLLNHRISTDSTIALHSHVLNGQFRVTKGKHVRSAENFYTEMEVH